MKRKISSALILILILCLSVLAFAESEEEAREQFQKLKSDFESEISYPPYSDYTYPEKQWDSESGRKIVAMGKEALPFVMEEIKNGNTDFTVAARRITGIKMWGPEAPDLARDWMNWWEDNQDDPEWNVFISEKSSKEGG